MSEDRPKGFLSRVFGPVEDDHTTVYSSGSDRDRGYDEYDDYEDERETDSRSRGIQETGRSFTVERAAEIIKHLPPEVPRSSAVRIVRQTLTAAGINIEELSESTRNREARLTSEIDQRQDRIAELRRTTDEQVRDLERRIREAKETRDNGISQEERRISTARDGLEDVERVREFFSLPKATSEQKPDVVEPEPSDGTRADPRPGEAVSDDTQVIDRSSFDDSSPSRDTRSASRPEESVSDDTQVIRGPLSERWERETREGRGEDRRR